MGQIIEIAMQLGNSVLGDPLFAFGGTAQVLFVHSLLGTSTSVDK